MKLLIGTKNQGKINELRDFLTDLPFEIFSLHDFTHIPEPAETGETFAENAALKAKYYARATGFWAISDDSGLEVKALSGAPGVYSARYAGENASDADRTLKLLEELNSTGDELRLARFVCAISVADAKGAIIFESEGICNGKIAHGLRGENGFGYDPIFIPEGYTETFGELSSTVKAEISHRARALKKIIGFLRDFTAHQLDQ